MNGKYYRLVLLLRCLANALWRGRAITKPSEIRAVAVVLTGKLGDIVCCTPVLRAIRKELPHARVIAIGGSVLKPLLADSTLADECLDIGDENIESRIRACRADVGIVTGPSFVSTALLYLAGILLVVAARVEGGSSPSETRLYRVLKNFIVTFPYRMGAYAPRERLRALEPIGIFSDDTKKHLGFSEIADKKVKKFLADSSIDIEKDFVVGISPSAGNKIKEWPEERFAEVADYVVAKYKAKVLIIGGSGDVEKVKKTKGYMKSDGEAVEITNFTLDELKALIAKLGLFIAVDTGPIYIAEAFGIPTVDITGPIDENEQPPQGLLHRNVVPPQRARPELFVLNAKQYNAAEALRQIRSITVAMVNKEIDVLITRSKTNEDGKRS